MTAKYYIALDSFLQDKANFASLNRFCLEIQANVNVPDYYGL